MKLTILGSGTVDPISTRACSGYFLETSVGPVVFDLGNGALRRAHQFCLPIHQAKLIFLSHLHPDHTADLVPLLFARKYAPSPWSESGDLTLVGPTGTQQFLDSIFSAWPSIVPGESGPSFRVKELETREQECWNQGDFSVTSYPVEHGDMKAFAFRFQEADKSLAYSGDSKLCSALSRVASGADLFLCECSCFPRGCEPLGCRDVHLSWEDVAEICAQACPKRLVLTHLYEPVLATQPNPLESLKNCLTMPVHLAHDGAVFTL